MKTKDKILHQALVLFNEKGVDQVSALEISQQLGISYGNLTYHFKKKEEMVLYLYQQMQKELNASITHLVQSIFEETYYLKLVNETFEVTWKYRFIYLNTNSLMVQFETIRQAEKDYAKSRTKILNKAKKYLIQEGYLKPETHVDYNMVIRNLSLILYSWITDAKLFYEGDEADKIDHYVALFYSVALPNFTQKGIERYQQLMK